MNRSLARHDRRVAFLDSLALLTGCTATVPGGLPDGRRPDVLRMDLARQVLFIGDGKYTEWPDCRETQARLLHYLRWLAAHVQVAGRRGILAVCFMHQGDSEGWLGLISQLVRDAGLLIEEDSVHDFSGGYLVASAVVRGRTKRPP